MNVPKEIRSPLGIRASEGPAGADILYNSPFLHIVASDEAANCTVANLSFGVGVYGGVTAHAASIDTKTTSRDLEIMDGCMFKLQVSRFMFWR